jgi:peptidoglycan/LPS O-acetylase OafA/YrhL
MSSAGAQKTKRAPFVIPSLDGVRAVSFSLVFLAHAGFPYIPGGFGVTVFFFLSGYLITTLLRKEAEESGAINFKLFYLRRVLRILPPFYAVLLLAFVLTRVGILPRDISWPALTAQVLHYSNYWVVDHGWGGLIAGTGVYWSLAVEEHFYLLFPALYAILIKARVAPRTQRSVLLGLCALVMLWRCYLVFGQGIISDRTYIASDTRFDSMLFGCALAVYGNPAIDVAKVERPSVAEWLAVLGGVTLLLITFLYRDPAFRESVRYSLQGIGLYPLFFVAVRHPNLLVTRFLNLRPVRFVGTLSFSLYLVHQVMLYCLELPFGEGAWQSAVALVLSGLLSLAIWRLIEKPCGKLRSRLSAQTGAAAPQPAA